MGKRRRNKLLKDVTIESIGAEGKGIARKEGKVIFVDGGIPGDTADVVVYKNKKAYAHARYHTVTAFSDLRQPAFCPHFEYCGGCKWQHLSYSQQLKYKQQIVVDALERIGKAAIGEVHPILGADPNRYYRNKMEFSFSNKRWLTPEEIRQEATISQRAGVGFHVSGAFDKVLDITECHLMDDLQNQIRNTLRDYALQEQLSFYDIRQQTGWLRNMFIRNTISGDWMVILVVSEWKEAPLQAIQSLLTDRFPAIKSFYAIENPKKNESIYDLTPRLLHGDPFLIETLGDRQYRIGPKSFFQTNTYQAKRLYDLVRTFADLQPTDRVYDLYTGAGSIALYVADRCEQVIGIESVPEAVEDAEANRALNGLHNLTFWAGDIKEILKPGFVADHGAPDVIITDPPRAGMHADVVEVIRQSGARRIVYVSCNPSTQARDIELLQDTYAVTRIQPVDMFPHTFHVENIAQLDLR